MPMLDPLNLLQQAAMEPLRRADSQWWLLLVDLVCAVERLQAAKDEIAEASADLAMVARNVRRTVNENKAKEP